MHRQLSSRPLSAALRCSVRFSPTPFIAETCWAWFRCRGSSTRTGHRRSPHSAIVIVRSIHGSPSATAHFATAPSTFHTVLQAHASLHQRSPLWLNGSRCSSISMSTTPDTTRPDPTVNAPVLSNVQPIESIHNVDTVLPHFRLEYG